ncbi:xanthine dehydrogenase accessory protein XdhC [Aureimonas altamirensis]|uniref:xanthine dehydrogenase accessory protein XdhC n=1 Tax=Aureimonas altamirensis TaxID=370622 RepID=UPI00068DD0A8|nr:xanthine dehydrogenase accessory protein XdhC [Aureimonas altamirensis]
MKLSVALADRLAAGEPAVLVRILAAHGSTPREAGAAMMVTPDGSKGTIGGGALEMEAIRKARSMIASGTADGFMDVPLGPAIGQCCGGRVELSLERLDAGVLDGVRRAEAAASGSAIPVLVFGAGHTGRAIALALQPLPFHVTVVDTRPQLLAELPSDIDSRAMPLPEQAVAAAPAQAAFLVVTHDHALDFHIAASALARADAAYVGMIGSATKRARFNRHLEEAGLGGQATRLHLPIGGRQVRDKRPEVIAAMVAAELLVHFMGTDVENPMHRLCTCP